MVLYYNTGPMGENIKVFGQTESSMEKANSSTQKKIPGERVYGMMEREYDGLVKMHKNIHKLFYF